jgi:heptosyltransferase-2
MKILIRGTNWIGDAVMTIPAMREMNRIFPDAHITLYTRSWAEGIFRDADFVDEIVSFDRKKRSITALTDEAALISRDGYDLAVIFPNSFESALVNKLAGIPRRIGYNKDLRGLLLTDPIPVPEWKNRRHEVFYYWELVAETEKRVLGRETIGNSAPDISLAVSDQRKSDARTFIEAAGGDLSRITIALGPGATNSRAKQWPAERFAALSDRLLNDLAANVLLLGSGEEAVITGRVAGTVGRRPIDLAGKTGLAEACAVLSVSDLFISNDMGLAHVAAAVGTPTVVIFGPTNDATTRPFADNSMVLRRPVECSPCMLRDCPIDHRCMTGISVDDVLSAAVSQLSPSSAIITDK